jgi:hypothetical protein
MKYNPFKPGSIVHPGMFAGRLDEIHTIEKLFYQTKNNNSSSFTVTGDRGIGKSSLLLYLKLIASGQIDTFDEVKFNFVVVNISLEPNDNYEEVIFKIARELYREIAKNSKVMTALKDIWEFVSNWEVLGVKYNKDKKELPANILLEELCEKMTSILQKAKSDSDGIYIFIDESDKPTKNPELGTLVKTMMERLQKNCINNVGFGIFGLPIISEKIKSSHESAIRLFTNVPLKQLTKEDSNIVIDLGVKEANSKNEIKISFDDDAREYIAKFSEGYPHFIQQYAYSAFDVNNDEVVDLKDLLKGLVDENGALHQLGERYFDKMYFKEIFSPKYRKILGVIAESEDEYITKRQIIDKSGLSESIVTNALNVCTRKGLLVKKKGSKGSYKISSLSFKVWISTLKNVDSK